MTLLAVGSVAFDDLETPSGKEENILGGSVSYFSLSASHFHPVQVVAVVGDDFGPEHQEVFGNRPIDLSGLVKLPGKCFRWKGSYGHDLNEAQTLDTQLNVFQDFHPKLPETYRSAPYLFLGNIDPTLQLNVVAQMVQRPTWIALDTMNFWIHGSAEALAKTLHEVDILLVNEAEARSISGERNLLKAFRIIQSMGPKILVVKRGECGAVLLTSQGIFATPAYPLEDVRDPTGAGDTFAGGFLGYLASQGNVEMSTLKRAMVAGTIMASFTVERFGTLGLTTASSLDIKSRMKAFSDMIYVNGL